MQSEVQEPSEFVKQALDKLRSSAKTPGTVTHLNVAYGANIMHRQEPIVDHSPSTNPKFVQTQRNLKPGSQGYEEMTGVTKGEVVAMRSKCAQNCKMQGRTSCPYCHGEGFAQKSARDSNVNKSINGSRDQLAEGDKAAVFTQGNKRVNPNVKAAGAFVVKTSGVV